MTPRDCTRVFITAAFTVSCLFGMAGDLKAQDNDGDGLTNEVEEAWETDPNKQDTDGDGLSDTEEFARRTDPLQAGPRPHTLSNKLSVAELGFGTETTGLKLLAIVYLPGGSTDGLTLRHGWLDLFTGKVVSKQIYPNSSVQALLIPAKKPGAKLLVLTHVVPSLAMDSLSIHRRLSTAALALVGKQEVAGTQTSFHLHWHKGGSTNIISQRVYAASIASYLVKNNYDCSNAICTSAEQNLTGGTHALGGGATSPSTSSPNGGGSLISYMQPLDDAPLPKPTWTFGQACNESSEYVGGVGAAKVFRVNVAECVPAHRHCASDCKEATGTKYEEIDYVSVVGG